MDTRVASGYAGKVTYAATVGLSGAFGTMISCSVMSWKSLRTQRIAIPRTDGECAKVEMWIPELLWDMLAR